MAHFVGGGKMNRVQFMTLGLVLAFVGTQLYFVDTYVLTPEATKVVGQADQSAKDAFQDDQAYNQSQEYYQPFRMASYSTDASMESQKPRKNLTPPKWICWPVFFLGAVFFLHGIALPVQSSSD